MQVELIWGNEVLNGCFANKTLIVTWQLTNSHAVPKWFVLFRLNSSGNEDFCCCCWYKLVSCVSNKILLFPLFLCLSCFLHTPLVRGTGKWAWDLEISEIFLGTKITILPWLWHLLTGPKHRIQGAEVQSSPFIDCHLNAWFVSF